MAEVKSTLAGDSSSASVDTLSESHRELITSSAIGEGVISARGYYTAIKRCQLADLGFKRHQQLVPALVIPIRDSRGSIVTYQIRPDTPRIAEDGRPVKYETPAKTPPALDVPSGAREELGSPITPLWITEGARKADAGVSAGLCCVSLPGVWSWAKRLNSDARTVIPDLQRVKLEERKVIVAFDSDVMVKPSVHQALEALATYLTSQGAAVSYCYLPNLEPGVKTGLDDFLAAGHSVEDLWRHVSEELRDPPKAKAKATKPALPTAKLLGTVENLLRLYVRFPDDHGPAALSLYALHTWTLDAAHVTPYIYIKSPQKRSGKTRLLEVLEFAVARPVRTSSLSAAGIYQVIQLMHPTLLIDEVDAIFSSKSEAAEALRCILNSGNRPGARVLRGTADGEPAWFETYGPKVLAGIDAGRLPDTIRDRSIVIGLERKMRSETVRRLRRDEIADQIDELAERLTLWAAENTEALSGHRSTLPEIEDRLEEAWEPLLGIAELAGGNWPDRGREAAIALSGGAEDAGEDRGQILIAALREIFGDSPAMFSKEITTKLNAEDELPFGAYRKGDGIDGRGLARALRPYRIRPTNVRVDEEQAKGYHRDDFTDVWERYAPEPNEGARTEPPMSGDLAVPASQDPAKPHAGRDSAGTDNGTDRNGTVSGSRSVPRSVPAQTHTQSQEPGVWDGGTDKPPGTGPPERALYSEGNGSGPTWDFTRPGDERDNAEAEAVGIATAQGLVDAGGAEWVRIGSPRRPAICRYPSHRVSDRPAPGGRLTCGTCHPLAEGSA